MADPYSSELGIPWMRLFRWRGRRNGLVCSVKGARVSRPGIPKRRDLCRLACFPWFVATAMALHGQMAWPDAGSVAEVMHRANDYWITNNFTTNSLGDSDWARSAYFAGNQRAAR